MPPDWVANTGKEAASPLVAERPFLFLNDPVGASELSPAFSQA
jgi:hypothetical protein